MWQITKKTFHRLSSLATALVLIAGMGTSTAAQNLFAPVVRVNNSVVTQYEVQQRERFLRLLNAPGATRQAALEALIDERLRDGATREVGLELDEEAITQGLAEFSARANLTTEEFVAELERGGVSRESFRDFVVSGIAWRELIRGRFARSIEITEADIDQALGSGANSSGIRLLLSEIIIPAPPENAEEVQALAEEISQSKTFAEFSNYASNYSATASRGRGGRLDWQDLSNLPPALRPILMALSPGEVTAPLPIPNAVALFQLRDIQETSGPTPEYAAIEYAVYYIAGGRTQDALSRAAEVRAQVDTCDDLYGVAKGQPVEVLERGSKKPAEIPQDIAMELSKLDSGEVSTALTRANGQTLVFLMLCGRTATVNEDAGREDAANALRSQRLEDYSAQYLEELRADARIVFE